MPCLPSESSTPHPVLTMPSPKPLNGSHLATTTESVPAAHLSGSSPVLPSFNAASWNHAERTISTHRVAGHSSTDQRHNLRRHTQAAAKAPSGSRAVGSLVVSVLALLGCLMAAHAIHVEHRQQQQFQEWRRAQ